MLESKELTGWNRGKDSESKKEQPAWEYQRKEFKERDKRGTCREKEIRRDERKYLQRTRVRCLLEDEKLETH